MFQGRRLAVVLVAAALVVTGISADEPVDGADGLLLGPLYRIEVAISLHAAQLHWLDSLTALGGPGLTAGKTREAHRLEFVRRHGEPTNDDLAVLQGFRDARIAHLKEASPDDRDALTLAFLEAPTLDDAIAAATKLIGAEHAQALANAFERFEPHYRVTWKDGAIPRRFVDKVKRSKRRSDVARFLVDVAAFYGVPHDERPSPRVVLAPVPPGHGTHAQAIGRHLLIEVRRAEGLADEVAPIVHENAHFLFKRIAAERREAFARFAEENDRSHAWALLAEALPTALAQGVAGKRFGRGWSTDEPWYHLADVDRYAKAIFPRVERALRDDEVLDETLLAELLGLEPTPRSP